MRRCALFSLLLFLGWAPAEAASFSVSGWIRYEDGDAMAGPGLASGSRFWRPAHLVQVYLSDGSTIYARTHTDSRGFFNFGATVPGDRPIMVILSVQNFALRVFLDTDKGNEWWDLIVADLPAGTSGAVDLGEVEIPVDYLPFTVQEGPTDWEDIQVAFAGALNINQVILATRADAMANRDPRETDTVDEVQVEYCDRGWNHYFSDLVLTCALVDGQPASSSQLDYGYVDKTVAHEYGHHLQWAIGGWDGHQGDHEICEEVDTTLWNDAEFAWSEGFANYLAYHMVNGDRRMSRVELPFEDNSSTLEQGCLNPGFVTSEDERWQAIEGFVTATLWDLADGLGSGPDAWDRVDGEAAGNHRRIMEIFDRELGTWEAPDLADFYPAWIARTNGLFDAIGQPAFDPILNRYAIVAGGTFAGAQRKMPALPLIEAAPLWPDRNRYQSTYTAGASTPLTVRRGFSLARDHAVLEEDVVVQLAASNLGPLTLPVAHPGSTGQANGASWTASVQHLDGSGWLAVTGDNGGPASGTFAPQALSRLHLRLLPAATSLAPWNQHRADVHVDFRFALPNGTATTSRQTVRVILDYADGPRSDPDNDDLSTEDELDRRGMFPCLNPADTDSDDDGLDDGEEIARHTSPCSSDTDGDGVSDWIEIQERCFQPNLPDNAAHPGSDPDGDGLSNEQELLRGTQRCDRDSDGDTRTGSDNWDGEDNCPVDPNPLQEDLDGDGRGDACDEDADGDRCPKPWDANDLDWDLLCELRPRNGRFVQEVDDRLQFLDGIPLGPEGPLPRECTRFGCPGPGSIWTDPAFKPISELRAEDLGLSEESGFGWASAALPDLDGDGWSEHAIAAPWEDGPAGRRVGAVHVISGADGRELGRVYGEEEEAGFGRSLAPLEGGELAVAAPGNTRTPGTVHVVDALRLAIARTYAAGEPGDQLGASLAAFEDAAGERFIAVGAPGSAEGAGALYLASGGGELQRIAAGKLAGDRFGEALAEAGDADGDGRPELWVGAPGAAGTGEAALVDLKGERRFTRAGGELSERYGAALAVVERGTAGEATAILVGAPESRAGGAAAGGRGELIDATGQVLAAVAGTVAGARLGGHVAAGPDLDGDGRPELVLVETASWPEGGGLGLSRFYRRNESPKR